MMALNGVREQIDDVDERILELLAERRGLVREVATLKDRTSGALRSPKREREVLDRLVGAGRRRALDGRLVTRVFQEILADSLDLQERLARDAARNGSDGDSAAQPIRAAFQGIAGAYSHLAARRFFGDGLTSKDLAPKARLVARLPVAEEPVEQLVALEGLEVHVPFVGVAAEPYVAFEVAKRFDHLL